MELKEFITKTLVDIFESVNETNDKIGSGKKFQLRTGDDILFDIAITVTEGTNKEKEGGIKVYALKLGMEKSNSNFNENVSRIKFKIKPNSNIG